MDQWLIDLLAAVNAKLVAQQLDPTDVHWSTRRRMAYEIRWPSWRQNEAHLDAAKGNRTKLDQLIAEEALIRNAIPSVEV